MNLRIFFIVLCAVVAGAWLSSEALAHTAGLPTLEEAFNSADVVTVARVEKEQRYIEDNTSCGSNYTVKLLKIFKKDSAHKHFLGISMRIGRAEGLELGRQYLLFVRYAENPHKEYERIFATDSRKVSASNKKLALRLIGCGGLVPGYLYDNEMAFPVQHGEVSVFGLWPRSAVPNSIKVHQKSGPQWLLDAKDVFQYLDELEKKRRPKS